MPTSESLNGGWARLDKAAVSDDKGQDEGWVTSAGLEQLPRLQKSVLGASLARGQRRFPNWTAVPTSEHKNQNRVAKKWGRHGYSIP